MHFDLHCHSTRSDGLLSPAAVVRRAASRGVDVLALTDHDDTAGLAEARVAAGEAGIAFVTGAELSVSWDDITIHVVALRFDPDHAACSAGSSRSAAAATAARGGSRSPWPAQESPAPTRAHAAT